MYVVRVGKYLMVTEIPTWGDSVQRPGPCTTVGVVNGGKNTKERLGPGQDASCIAIHSPESDCFRPLSRYRGLSLDEFPELRGRTRVITRSAISVRRVSVAESVPAVLFAMMYHRSRPRQDEIL